MAYKQKPGRGKCSPFKAVEKYTNSPLMNGDGDDKKLSTRRQVKKGLIEDPASDLPSNWKAVWRKGEYAGAKEKKMKPGKGGKGDKRTPKEQTSYGKGRISTFHNMPLKDRFKARLKGHKPTDERYVKYGVAEQPVEGFNVINTKK